MSGVFTTLCAQKFYKNPGPSKDISRLYFSGGVHAGFWALMGQNEIPYNLQADYRSKRDLFFGLGFTYDRYKYSPFESVPSQRFNLRFRFLGFINDQNATVSQYLGGAVGLSYWKLDHGSYPDYLKNPEYWPTIQFLYGIKIKFNDDWFLLTEFGLGPPYAAQTSLGFTF
jgi:hypothetical protein